MKTAYSDCRYSSPEQNEYPSGQGCVPTDHWVKEVSLSQQLKTFPETRRPKSHSEYHQGSRPFKAKDALSPQTSHQPSVRFRFVCSYPLWQTYRRSRSRIQPAQTRDSLLPPFTLMGLLGGGWQRLSGRNDLRNEKDGPQCCEVRARCIG